MSNKKIKIFLILFLVFFSMSYFLEYKIPKKIIPSENLKERDFQKNIILKHKVINYIKPKETIFINIEDKNLNYTIIIFENQNLQINQTYLFYGKLSNYNSKYSFIVYKFEKYEK